MKNVPILVLGNGLTGLGVLRCVAELGVEVQVVADQPTLMRRSRHYRPAPGTEAEARADLPGYLEKLPWQRAVLIPCSDHWALAISRLPRELRSRFVASVPPAHVLTTLVDKLGLARLLKTLGLPHPETTQLHNEQDLVDVRDEVLTRSFLKPRDSQRFFAVYNAKGVRLSGRIQAMRVLKTVISAGHQMVLQEYVDGPASNHYFIDGFATASGSINALFVRRRLRMYPDDFGNSTYMTSVAPDEAAPAVEALRRLLDHVGYRGPFSAEFKRDARDGDFKLLEVNVRPWWYVEYAARCGVNVCAMAYNDALGLPVQPVASYPVGRTYVYPAYDFDACNVLRRRGALSWLGMARSWAAAMNPVFRFSDPGPGIAVAWTFLANRFRRAATRVTSTSKVWELDSPTAS